MKRKAKSPSFIISIIPLVVLILSLICVIKVFKADALSGGGQVSLLFAAAVGVALHFFVCGGDWETLEKSILDNFRMIGIPTIILLLIGAIAGTWMVSGIVPTLICYGLKVIAPKIFLFAACIICALVSVVTGSSWTTIATLGVALIGIGTAQGYDPAWVAGAIISGAYFGDKISPLSDTTTLASSSCGVPLFEHIRYMMKTTVPSISIALALYLIFSLLHKTADSSQMELFSDSLYSSFNITPWVLIVPVLTGILIAKKAPAIITLFLASFMAAITALIAQPEIVWSVATGLPPEQYCGMSFLEGFKGIIIAVCSQTNVDTGNAALNDLVMTKGMTGMLNTIFLIFTAVIFGGVLVGSGMILSITKALIRFARKTASLVGATVCTGLLCDMATGDQFLSIILTSNLFKKLYEDSGYEPRLLSRSVEDSATVTSVLIPWNSCGMTQSTVLHVATAAYFPFCFFNILSPLMSVFVAAFSKKIVRKNLVA